MKTDIFKDLVQIKDMPFVEVYDLAKEIVMENLSVEDKGNLYRTILGVQELCQVIMSKIKL